MSRLLGNARLRALSLTLVSMALVLAAPLGALAEPAPFANLGASLLVQSQGGQPLLLVSGVLPDEVPLPAEVALPVPEGSQIEWAGEIVGQTVEEDIRTEAVIEERDGITVAVFTLTTSRIAQVEVVYSGATRPAADGASEAGFALAAPAPAELARLAIALPPGGNVSVLPEGMLASPGPDGYTYYYVDISDVAAGDPLELSIGYTLSAAAQPVPASPAAPSSDVPPLLIVVLAAVFAGAILMALASRARARSAVYMDDETVEADTEPADEAYLSSSAPVDDASDSPYVADEVASSSADETPVETEPARDTATGFLTPRVLLIAAAFLVLGIALAVNLTGESSQVGVIDISGGWINQRISTADAAEQIDYAIRISCECPIEAEAPKIFEVLAGVPGVATASLEQATLLLRVAYDPSLTNEVAIAGALRSKGYLP